MRLTGLIVAAVFLDGINITSGQNQKAFHSMAYGDMYININKECRKI